MKLYRFGNTFIPENQITGFRLAAAGKDDKWEDVYEIEVNTTYGQFFLSKMPLESAVLLLKTTFSGDVRNVSNQDSSDYEDLLRLTGQA